MARAWYGAIFVALSILPASAWAQQAISSAPVLAELHGSDAPGLWDYTAIDSATGRLLLARMTGVGTVILADNRLGPMLASGHHVHDVLPLPGRRVLFTNGDTNTATVVGAERGEVLDSVATGAGPDGAIFDPASRQVLVMNGRAGTITRIAITDKNARALTTIPVGGKLEAAALDGHGRLFVNIEDRDQIAVVSLAAGQVVVRYMLPGCESPTGLAYDVVRDWLVAACANGVAEILRGDGHVARRLSIGPRPDAVIADPAHARVFIPSGGNATLSEIDLSGAPHVIRVMRTRAGARTGAYDPHTERLYLPFGTVVRTSGRSPHLVPGSFGLLVVDVR